MFTLQKTFKRQKSYFCTTAATISVDKLLQPREMTKETHKRTNFSQKFFACLFFYLRNVSAQQLSVEVLEQQETLSVTHAQTQTDTQGG